MSEPTPPRRSRRRLALVAILIALVGGPALLLLNRKERPAPPAPAAETPAPAPSAEPAPTPPTAAEAFARLYPRPDQPLAWSGEIHQVHFAPVGLYPLAGGVFALVSSAQNASDCHACPGFYSVNYLKPGVGGLKRVGEPLVGSASDGGGGRPPTISVDRALSVVPTLVVRSSYLATGEQSGWIDLVKLGERPILVAEDMPALYDDTGALGTCHIEGGLRAGEKDQVFAMVYTGAWRRAVTWRWETGRWRSSEPDLQLSAKCPAPGST